jgi:hypothetical protein
MRRVVASSDSRSGNRAASGPGWLLALLVDFRADFLADFLPDFFVDLLDFFDLLEDFERDVLAMDHLIERVLE